MYYCCSCRFFFRKQLTIYCANLAEPLPADFEIALAMARAMFMESISGGLVWIVTGDKERGASVAEITAAEKLKSECGKSNILYKL